MSEHGKSEEYKPLSKNKVLLRREGKMREEVDREGILMLLYLGLLKDKLVDDTADIVTD